MPTAALQFRVEVMDDAAERSQGLMHRESLPRFAGMLFVYESAAAGGLLDAEHADPARHAVLRRHRPPVANQGERPAARRDAGGRRRRRSATCSRSTAGWRPSSASTSAPSSAIRRSTRPPPPGPAERRHLPFPPPPEPLEGPMWFTSDNTQPAAPEVMAALARANDGHAASYGADAVDGPGRRRSSAPSSRRRRPRCTWSPPAPPRTRWRSPASPRPGARSTATPRRT